MIENIIKIQLKIGFYKLGASPKDHSVEGKIVVHRVLMSPILITTPKNFLMITEKLEVT